MDSVLMALYVAVLFFVLAPGVLVTLPRGGSRNTVLATHALVAAVVFYFTHQMAFKFLRQFEGFQDNAMNAQLKREGFQQAKRTNTPAY
uniref:Uncharacterized protein n=1 Tax=viral metagenome TaxID=1070528 RepID=A0A6C0BI84_9ZZZZ